MLLAAYVVAGFAVAGVYAAGMLRGRRDRYHRLGLLIPMTVGAVAIPLQIGMGDVIARAVYHDEPAKFAAIEALPRTGSHVPEVLGGVLVDGHVRYGVPVPDGASLLSGFSPGTRISGLDAIPAAVRPPDQLVTTVHLSFDVMVGTGFALLGLALWFALAWWRHRLRQPGRWFLRATAVSGAVAVVSLETGWITTEVGRQPWTVVGLLLTRDAVATSGQPVAAVRRRGRDLRRGDGGSGLRAARAAPALGGGRQDSPTAGPVRRRRRDHRRRRHAARRHRPATASSAEPTSAPASGTSPPVEPVRGARPRSLIDHAIGPVWEANHTWLIFCLVVLWTGFPTAFTAIMTTLYIPLGIAAFGIVLRGSGFAFRKVSMRTAEQRLNGVAFAASSVITPFCFGAVAGGIASGRVPTRRSR